MASLAPDFWVRDIWAGQGGSLSSGEHVTGILHKAVPLGLLTRSRFACLLSLTVIIMRPEVK